MTFSSMDALKNYILSRSQVAVQRAQERVYKVLDHFVGNFYIEYEPSLYVRTYQFYRSLVKSDVIRTANGYEVQVYFDITQLDHSMKSLQGIGTWGNKGWSEEKILNTAMVGSAPHGGYAPAGGTGIWNNAMPIISQNAYNYLKQELIKAGIPLK